jgi:Permuted papain-like amidase enzyme, YaeF/YiiX, C92 family
MFSLKKRTIVVVSLVAIVAIGSWQAVRYWQAKQKEERATREKHRDQNRWNLKMIDSAVAMLHSGDLVVRTGAGAISEMLLKMNQKDQTYSHCGIVMVENGYPFVYHSIGGEDNPDECVRRDSASIFFSPVHNLGIGLYRYDFTGPQIDSLRNAISLYYKERRKFDMDFDLKTDDKLYCAEFAYKAINTATHDSTYIKLTHVSDYTFVGVDDLFTSNHARPIWRIKYK